MTARRRPGMRRLVDNTVALVLAGEVSMDVAAQTLLANGVPVAVIGRVLSGAAAAASRPPAPDAATSACSLAADGFQPTLMQRTA